MNRTNILQELINKYSFRSFCEIGVQMGHNFNAIECEHKVGVDPDKSSAATIFETSDEFFSKLKTKYDIFWIDGLHESPVVERDIVNALNNLNEGGFVCCHDMLPTNFHMTEIPLTDQNEWTGDCFKAFIKLRTERDDLTFHVVDCDWGCSIITKNAVGIKTDLLKIDIPINYENFVANKQEWMNIITPEEFKQIYLS